MRSTILADKEKLTEAIENTKSSKACLIYLGLSTGSQNSKRLAKYAALHGLALKTFNRNTSICADKTLLLAAVTNTPNMSECLKYLGFKGKSGHTTVTKYAKLYNITLKRDWVKLEETPERSCLKCEETFERPRSSKAKYCKKCTPTIVGNSTLTLEAVRNSKSVKGKHPSWVNTYVRQQARNIHRKLLEHGKCEVCGYDKHIELCHIIGITDWPEDSLLTTVNSRDNIRLLCRNHHWEFDHGYYL